MENGDKITFKIQSIDNPPTAQDNEGFAIVFVPKKGFQWAKYFNGSKTWISNITFKEIRPTMWLRKL